MIVFIQPDGNASIKRWIANETIRPSRRNASVVNLVTHSWWSQLARTQSCRLSCVLYHI